MKRSRINRAMKDMETFIAKYKFALPPFCKWTLEEWKEKGAECDEIRDNMLGWDITDFGMGNFDEIGLSLITLRNGSQKNPNYPKPYAEKIFMLLPGQHTPLEYHWNKMEDIINRGGDDVYITVYNGAEDGKLLDTDVLVVTDGVRRTVSAGTKIKLSPGESITFTQLLYHNLEALKDGGPVLLGEVSMCNDDENDSHFYNASGRFPGIEEDEKPYRYLCNEYPRGK